MTASPLVVAKSPAQVRAGTYVGLFLITLSTLMYEIALTRIFSVTMWYHFAFVAISVALFGMTAGALAVHLLPKVFDRLDVKRHLWMYSLAFSIAIAACFMTQLQIRFNPVFTLSGVLSVMATCVVISLPFIASGVVVCLALTRFPERTNRLYAVDLIGAGLGCILLVLLFSVFDGPSLVILVAALAALGSLVFALDAGSRKGAVAAGLVMLLLGSLAIVNTQKNDDGDPLIAIKWTKGVRDTDHVYERWNAFSRLTVDGDPEKDDSLSLVIDSTAGTGLTRFDGDPTSTDHLRTSLRNLPYHLREDADVMVVGVGGGGDILAALEFEPKSVTGAEINGDILDITNNVFGDFTGHLDRDPRVNFVNDEARSYLAGADKKFDIIQISLIDTWAATAAGAFALSENGLYTTDAWDIYFDRLKADGILTVTRFFSTPGANEPLETERLTALAAQSLTDHGIENPRDHLLIYKAESGYPGVQLATLMVSMEPFSSSDLSTLEYQANRRKFDRVITPDAAYSPMFEDLVAPGGPSDAVASRVEDISPPDDNRPYFFQMADLNTFSSGRIFENELSTRPVLVLGLLAVTVLLLAACCVFLPMLLGRRQRKKADEAHPKGMVAFYTYFAGIGLGFLLIEISQLQRLSIFLGHPTYSLTVVLFSILIASGIGSMLSERILRSDSPNARIIPLLVLLATVIVFGLATPYVVDAMDGAPAMTRIATAVALLVPLGLVMGMPFSIGMNTASRRPGTPTAFLWGINGATSVCASVLAILVSLFFGVYAAFWLGVLAYVMATASMYVITRNPPDETIDLTDEEEVEDVPVPVGLST